MFKTDSMAYTQAQLDTMLLEVQAAISKCLTAQEYTAGIQVGLKRPTLESLQKRELWLLTELGRLGSSGAVNHVQFGSVS